MRTTLATLLLLFGTWFTCASPTWAQGRGFQVNHFEPTAAGEQSLWVDHPWYSRTRYLAAGLTFNYARNPLVFGQSGPDGFQSQGAIVAHQLLGHLDLAGSFLDRVTLALSLPIVLLERGEARYGLAPLGGVAVGDLRLGARVRILGQPGRSALSLHAGLDLWIPFNLGDDPPFPAQTGDRGLRLMPKFIVAGLPRSWLLYAATAAFYYRPESSLGDLPEGAGNGMGSQMQLGLRLAYFNSRLRLALGPEALLSTILTGGRAFTQDGTSLELLVGAHYNLLRLLQISVGGGVGLLREPGTPEGRALLRISYAPIRPEPIPDRDRDGVPDEQDACPLQPGPRQGEPGKNGCPLEPPRDGDGDGIADRDDLCPEEAAGPRPHPQRRGCPDKDQDNDGVFDSSDRCPREPAGPHPDPSRPGCPEPDGDGDGVFDSSDRCPREPAGPHPDPSRPGCPDKDSDGDGVYDAQDRCPRERPGLNPDPERPGCPAPDRDRDQVPDRVDACPDTPGAPRRDPKKNGCPGLIVVDGGQIKILKQVFFANGKDTVLKKSFPVLDAVAESLSAMPLIRKVSIEGHTDDKGKAEANRALSERRARNVLQYLVSKGIAAERLTARGFGPDRPVASNKSNKGRAQNRRTEFIITDPAQLPSAAAAPPQAPPAKQARSGRRGKR